MSETSHESTICSYVLLSIDSSGVRVLSISARLLLQRAVEPISVLLFRHRQTIYLQNLPALSGTGMEVYMFSYRLISFSTPLFF